MIAMKTKKLDTLTSHSLELASDMLRGTNTGDIKQLQIQSCSDGMIATAQYKGMIYTIHIKPTFTVLDESVEPDETGDRAAFESHQRSVSRARS